MYLLDFYERRYDSIITSSFQELLRLREIYPDEIDETNDYDPDYNHIQEILEKRFPVIEKILTIGEGKISLCGPFILDIMFWSDENYDTADMYIHSCDLVTADNLIQRCILLPDIKVKYKRDHIQIMVEDDEDEICIKLYLDVFEGRHEILKHINPTPFRCGIDPVAKYFSTFNSILSLAIKVVPIDIFPDIRKLDICNIFGIIPIFHGKSYVKFDDPKSHRDVIVYDCRRCHLFTMYVPDLIVDNTYYDKMREVVLHKNIKKSSVDPRSYFGKEYTPIEVGISNDRFLAFYRIKYIVGDDLFRILCDSWLSTEVFDVMRKLLQSN